MRQDHIDGHQTGRGLVSELAFIFMVIFLLTHFVPGHDDHRRLSSWFIMFCVVRLMCGCFFVLPEQQDEEEEMGRKVQ